MIASDSDGDSEEMRWIKIDATTANGGGYSDKASLQSGPVTGPGKHLRQRSCAADLYCPSLFRDHEKYSKSKQRAPKLNELNLMSRSGSRMRQTLAMMAHQYDG